MLVIVSLPAMAQERAIRQDSMRKKLSALTNDTAKVNLLNKLAASYIQTNQDSTSGIAQQAKALAGQIKYEKGIADAAIYIAIVKRQRGNYIAALDEFLNSIKIYEKLKATSLQAGGYIHIAQVYKDISGHNLTLKYLETGIDYSQLAYRLYHSTPDTAGMVDALNMQGIIYRDIGKLPGREHYYDTAYQVYTRALQLIRRSGKGTAYTGKLYNNISQVYLEYKKDYTKALDYLFQAVEFNKSRHNFSSLSYNYGNISNAYVKLNNHTQALLYARKMEETALQLHWPERLVNAYQQLHTSFKAGGQYDSALHYYVLADKLDDSLNNVAKTNEVVDLQTKYETAKKESQIQTLQIEGIDKNRRITVLVIGVIIFAGLTVCMIWLYRRVKKQRQQIAIQSKNLETMMKELHHRVKNNLQIVSSLLSLQTYKVQDAGAVSVLRESQQRVQAMSFIHQRLYKKDELTSVNMKEYFTDLAESLLASYGFDRDHFDLRIKIDREMMDIDKALPIGLIINEMITNSLKYAYQDIKHPSLLISLTEDTSNMFFLIKDNGIGINEEAWKQKNNSFGKQLIGALCKQMRAKQTLVIDGGTAFTITIPREVA